jgi:pyruvate/2-oxoglutarate dehydrogenase complex dihydrolipoamide dehydrogenase (E3) component/uncharacterized membrane protein YdjX (TVP38/TMEM64 family)
MNTKKLILVVAAVALVGVFFALDLGRFFSFSAIGESRDWLQGHYDASPAFVLAGYFFAYVLMAALSIPGATVMTLLGGAVFGLVGGTLVVSVASTLGATLAFLLARYLFRDAVQRRFGRMLTPINRGVDREGGTYLFALRLVPVFPFFAVNLVIALTRIRVWTYVWVSQLGMLPATVIYVNAGLQVGALDSPKDVLSPSFIGAFVLLGLLPLVSRRVLDGVRTRRVLAPYPKPATFDRNLVVIGAGAAGLVTAYIAAAVKAKVTLVERHKMGGDCLNTGCVPSKALLRAARHVSDIRRAKKIGIDAGEPEIDFAAVMASVHSAIAKIEPHDSVERYTDLGVECRIGEATIVSPWCVEVDGERLTTRSIVIATGARPFVPPIPGLDSVAYHTSDNIWTLTELPKRLVILGGGPIGCEMAQAFSRLGAEVTIVEMASSLLSRDEPEFGQQMSKVLTEDGVRLLLGTKAAGVKGDGASEGSLECETDNGAIEVPFDCLLLAVGRKPNVTGFGLEELGINTAAGGVVETNEYLQTLFPNIYACGDVAGPFQFTHTAAHQAYYAAVNSLFGDFKKSATDYRVLPRVTYTDPEVASVGIGEKEASDENIEVEVTRYGLDDLDRAIVDGEAHGEVKVITAAGSDRILGAHIMGAHAGELIAEFSLAMKYNLGLKKILGTVHAYPTMMEANKYAAGAWSRAHAPAKALGYLERFHAWRRG